MRDILKVYFLVACAHLLLLDIGCLLLAADGAAVATWKSLVALFSFPVLMWCGAILLFRRLSVKMHLLIAGLSCCTFACVVPGIKARRHQESVAAKVLNLGAKLVFVPDGKTLLWLYLSLPREMKPRLIVRVTILEGPTDGQVENVIRCLETIDFDGQLFLYDASRLTNRSLSAIGRLKHLTNLKVECATGISDDGIHFLTSLTELDRLMLKGTLLPGGSRGGRITDRGAAALSHFKSLRSLSLYGMPVTGEFLDDFQPNTTLEILDLNLTEFCDANAPLLLKFPKLRELQLMVTPVTDEAIDSIAQLENVSFLTLNKTLVTDVGISKLSGVLSKPNAKLWIRGTRVRNTRRLLEEYPQAEIVR